MSESQIRPHDNAQVVHEGHHVCLVLHVCNHSTHACMHEECKINDALSSSSIPSFFSCSLFSCFLSFLLPCKRSTNKRLEHNERILLQWRSTSLPCHVPDSIRGPTWCRKDTVQVSAGLMFQSRRTWYYYYSTVACLVTGLKLDFEGKCLMPQAVLPRDHPDALKPWFSTSRTATPPKETSLKPLFWVKTRAFWRTESQQIWRRSLQIIHNLLVST